MAVHAHYAAHALPHDPRGIIRPALDDAKTCASVLLGEPTAGGHLLAAAAVAVDGNTVFSDPRSDLTCNNDSGRFVPRKRARVGDAGAVGAGFTMDGRRALLPPVAQAFASVGDVQSRVLCSGAASTSGRHAGAAAASHGLLSHLNRHSVEIDALLRVQNERLRAALEEARRRHLRALVSAVQRAAARRLRDAEAELERALARNAELEDRLRRMGAEGQEWQIIARNHEAAAAGLRATLDQLLQSPCAAAGGDGDAEDAQSCCFEQERADDDDGNQARGGMARTRAWCKACGEADACVLLLPCRHLCLCPGCEPPSRSAPCARPPRTPRSTSCCRDRTPTCPLDWPRL